MLNSDRLNDHRSWDHCGRSGALAALLERDVMDLGDLLNDLGCGGHSCGLGGAGLLIGGNEGLLSFCDNCAEDADAFLRKFEEVGSGGGAFFEDFPFLLDGDFLNEGCLLVDVDLTDDGNFCVVKLRNVNIILIGW